MKQVKAFIHPHRVADVVHRLTAAGFARLTLFDVRGLLQALDKREQRYSVEVGDSVIDEVQLELACEDAGVEKAVSLIRESAGSGDGWVYVLPVEAVYRLGRDSHQEA